MNDITMEKKLQLVQQIRSQYHQNQYDLSNREQILYGKIREEPKETGTSESLKLRCAVAIVGFLFVILLDSRGISLFGLNMEQVFTYIAADYRESVTEFVETITGKIAIDSPVP